MQPAFSMLQKLKWLRFKCYRMSNFAVVMEDVTPRRKRRNMVDAGPEEKKPKHCHEAESGTGTKPGYAYFCKFCPAVFKNGADWSQHVAAHEALVSLISNSKSLKVIIGKRFAWSFQAIANHAMMKGNGGERENSAEGAVRRTATEQRAFQVPDPYSDPSYHKRSQ